MNDQRVKKRRLRASQWITLAALLLALAHLVFPGVAIDAATLTLLVIAVAPWLGVVFKSIELPGFKAEYHEELLGDSEDRARITKEENLRPGQELGRSDASGEGVRSAAVNSHLLIEQLAIARLEKDLGARVDRGVRVQRGQRALFLDGVARDERDRDQVIEVKWLRAGDVDPERIPMDSLLSRVLEYREITGRDAYLVLAVVIPERTEATTAGRERLVARLRETRKNWTLYVYTYADIDLPRALRGEV